MMIDWFGYVSLPFTTALLAMLWRQKYQAEKALREVKSEFDTIFNNVNPICVTNFDHEIMMANHAYIETFGPVEHKGVKLKCFESRPGDCCHTDICPLQQVIDQGKTELVSETVKHHNGTSQYFVITSKPLKNMAGKMVGVMESFQDVTAIKQFEMEKEKIKHLEALGVIAGGIAHDFNNLLQVIVGNVSLIEIISVPNSEVAPLLKAVMAASWQAKKLTQKILTFSKGGAPLLRPTVLPDLVRRVVRETAIAEGIVVQLDIPPHLYLLAADESQLFQAFSNIIKNAEEAMPDGGTLWVTASNQELAEVQEHLGDQVSPAANYTHITIRDTGRGIPAEHLARIFDPYFSSKKKGCQKGTGLGLSTAYSIVKRHNGSIRVESAVGAGTTVHLYLPAEKGSVGQQERAHGDSGRSTHSILLMDDEDLVREAAASMLSHLHWQVELARNGEEALSLYQQAMAKGEPFAFVILDLTIVGGMGGLEALSGLRQIDPNVRAIVSSGYTEDPAMADFEGHGFCAAIAKPYSLDSLKALLAQLAEKMPTSNDIH